MTHLQIWLQNHNRRLTQDAIDEALMEYINKVEAERDALKLDAERYQWLRLQHWNDSEFCVVSQPKENVALGAYCPFGTYLDSEIDASMKGEL